MFAYGTPTTKWVEVEEPQGVTHFSALLSFTVAPSIFMDVYKEESFIVAVLIKFFSHLNNVCLAKMKSTEVGKDDFRTSENQHIFK